MVAGSTPAEFSIHKIENYNFDQLSPRTDFRGSEAGDTSLLTKQSLQPFFSSKTFEAVRIALLRQYLT